MKKILPNGYSIYVRHGSKVEYIRFNIDVYKNGNEAMYVYIYNTGSCTAAMNEKLFSVLD